MRIRIDPLSGHLEIDCEKTEIRGRWGAAALTELITLCLDRGGRGAVDAETLCERLTVYGLQGGLDRNQWKRVWTNVQSAFLKVGREDDFLLRFGNGPRSVTTGPWNWNSWPTDTLECVNRPSLAHSSEAAQVPGLAFSGSLNHSLRISRKLASCHVLWTAGSRRDAAQEFLSGEEWGLATPEVLTHRELIIADALIMSSQCDSALVHLKKARDLIDRHVHCKHHGCYERLLTIAAPEFHRGVTATRSAGDRVMAMLKQSQRKGDELDTRARSWALTYASNCMAQDFGNSQCGGVGEEVMRQMIELSFSGVYFSIAGSHYDIVPVAHENLQRNLILLRSSTLVGLGDILDVYQCAALWWGLMDPPEAFSIGRAWLGIFALLDSAALIEIYKRVKAFEWLGPVPDSYEYYENNLNYALSVNDPMHIARVALSCLVFSRKNRNLVGASQAEKKLVEVIAAHPEIRARLNRDGFFLEHLPK